MRNLITILSLFFLAQMPGLAGAEIISSGELLEVSAQNAETVRSEIISALTRLGLSKAEAEMRLNALTPREQRQLLWTLAHMPVAGAQDIRSSY